MKRSTSRDSSNRHANVSMRGQLAQADDTKLMQELQFTGYSGEAQQIIEHAQPYGFDSVPLPPNGSDGSSGSGETTGGSIGGSNNFLGVAAEHFSTMVNSGRSHGVTMHVPDRRFRLFKKQPGEVAMYDHLGQWIYFRTMQQSGSGSGGSGSGGGSSGSMQGQLFHKVPNGFQHFVQVDQQSQQGSSGGSGGSGGGSSGGTTYGQDATQIPQPYAYHSIDKNSRTVSHPQLVQHQVTSGNGGSNAQAQHSIVIKSGTGVTTTTQNAILETAQQTITNKAQTITHNGKTNLNGDTTIENNLQVSQNISTGSMGMASDRRIKSRFSLFENALTLAMQLSVCRFNVHHSSFRKGKLRVWRKGMRKSIGAIAQDVRRVFPEIVRGDEDKEVLTVEESKFGLIAIAALQEFVLEARRENAELRARINDLEDILAEREQ
jgi:Bacteriophage Mu Gp45 spike protein/Chaperone of endosialidase